MQSQGQPEPSKIDRPTVLPEGTHMERREDGSVWQVTPAIRAHDEDGKEKPGPDTLEFRVDSDKDAEFIQKGGVPWYFKHLGESIPGAREEIGSSAQITNILARLDAAEARADAAEARADAAEDDKVDVAPPAPLAALVAEKKAEVVEPAPVVLPKPKVKRTARSSKK